MRDIETIDGEPRLVAALRRAARERGGPLPSTNASATQLIGSARRPSRMMGRIEQLCYCVRASRRTAIVSATSRLVIAAFGTRREPWKVPGNKCSSTATPAARRASA